MKLILLRHGETEENIDCIAEGQLPGYLTEKGKLQIEFIAPQLVEENIDLIYSSDLNRALQTTDIVERFVKNTRVRLSKKLRERNFGDFQGKPYPKDWDEIQWQPGIIKEHGGESSGELILRVKSFLKKLNTKFPDKTILLITHKRVIQVIQAIHKHQGLEELQKMSIPGNAEVVYLEFDLDFFKKK